MDTLYQERVAEAIELEANKIIGETGSNVLDDYPVRVGRAQGLLRALEILKEIDREMAKEG